MGHLADEGLPTTTTTATKDTTGKMGTSGREGGADGAGDAADLIHVCRSALLPRAAYQFYRAILLAFLATGGPPDRQALRALARRYAVPLEATMADMARQDLVQRDPATGAIRAAYPFSGVPTAHRVTLLADSADSDQPDRREGAAKLQLYAMCALDALGIPLMLRREALVSSVDALTGAVVRVTVRQQSSAAGAALVPAGETGQTADGLDGWVGSWEPASAVVYARPEEHECAGGVAAGSCCPLTNFFVSREQADQWAAAHGSPEDVVLAPGEALRRAHALFAGVLDRLPA